VTKAWSPERLFRDIGEAQAWNALMSYSGASLPLAAKDAVCAFAPAPDPAPNERAALISTTRGQKLIVIFRSFPFAALGAPDLTPADVAHCPQSLASALYEGMLAFVWNALPHAAPGGFALRELGAGAALASEFGASELKWIEAHFVGLANAPVETLIGCRAVDIGGLLASLGAGGLRAAEAVKQQFTREVYLGAERLTLPLSEFRAIKRGDLVVFDIKAGDRLYLRAGAAVFELTRDDAKGWRVSSARTDRRAAQTLHPAQSAPMTADAMQPSSDAISDVSELPVTVDFDLGAVTKSLAEIESWREGSVVALETPTLEPGCVVTIRVNGATVGEGDLVKIDDRFAVRISRWLKQS
jgi:flagellar motor switch/type III secretory pathway protein FliN